MSKEVFKAQESGQGAAAATTPDQLLFSESLDTMIQSFKEKNEKKPESTAEGIIMGAAGAGAAAAGVNDQAVDKVKQLMDGMRKPDVVVDEGIKPFNVDKTYARLVGAISDADDAVAGMPLLDKQIAKVEGRVQALTETSNALEQHMRDAALKHFTKQDYKEFSKLGLDQLTNPNPKVGFEVNPQQRAWLKENHPDIYRMLEKHDRTSLEATNTQSGLNDLVEIRDKPIQARLDLARYEQNKGFGESAIKTLTELARTRPSVIDGNGEFRQLAIESGAAWNPGFRKAIEQNGGNILDFVQRPKPILDFKVPIKPAWEPNPQEKKIQKDQ